MRTRFSFVAGSLALAAIARLPNAARAETQTGLAAGSAVSATYVPVVASTPGFGDSRFVSSLAVVNPHPFPMTVTAYLLPGGTDNRGFRASARTLNLPGNGSIRIPDPLVTLWGATGLATIYLESTPAAGNDGAFIVDSRLLNVANPSATYGLSVPATLSGIRPSDRGYAADIESDSRYRTNVGIFNDSATIASVRVEVVADDGAVIGSKNYSLQPYSLTQDAVTNVTAATFAHASLRLTPIAVSGGQIIAYVAVADNATSDAAVSLVQPYTPLSGSAAAILIELSRYSFSPGGPSGPPIALRAGTEYELTFRATDTAHGISAIPQLAIAGNASIEPGSDYVVTVTPTDAQRGARFNFACTRFCGAGHGGMYGSIQIE